MGVQLGAVTPVFFAFRDREFVLDQIEKVTGGRFHPNFDRIGGLKDDLPKGWIDSTKSTMDKVRSFCDEIEDLLLGLGDLPDPHPRDRCDPARRRPAVRPVRGERPRLGHRLGPPPRQLHRPRVPGARLEGLDPPRRRLLRPLLGSSAGGPRGRQDDRPALRRPAERADHGEGAPDHQGARRRGVRVHREPARRDGLLRRVPGRSHARSASRSAPPASTTCRSRRGCCAVCTCPTSSRSSRRCTSSWGTSTDDASVLAARARLLAGDHSSRCWSAWSQRWLSPVRSSTCTCSSSCPSCRAVSARWKPAPTVRCSCSPRSASGSRRRTSFPERSDRFVFGLAPAVVLTSTFLIFVVIPAGPNAVIADLGTGHLLRAGRVLALGDRHPDGRLGVGQQVRAHRWPAGGRPAHRLRAAAGARRRGCGDHRRQPQPAGHRRRTGRRDRSSAGTASATRSSSPSSSGS